MIPPSARPDLGWRENSGSPLCTLTAAGALRLHASRIAPSIASGRHGDIAYSHSAHRDGSPYLGPIRLPVLAFDFDSIGAFAVRCMNSANVAAGSGIFFFAAMVSNFFRNRGSASTVL